MLSPEEQEEQHRIIAEQNEILAGAPAFAVKRAAQKAKLEAMTKLGILPKNENPNLMQPHIDTLQAIGDGQHDGEDLSELLDKIDQAAQALLDAGMAETYDDLIGKSAERWVLLDEQQNG